MSQYFRNGDFEIKSLEFENSKLNFLVPDLNSKIWTINLSNLFGPMLRDEIGLELGGPIAFMSTGLTFIIDAICAIFQINRAVFYNHQGFSTNLHNDDEIKQFNSALNSIAASFPKSAIIVRSIRQTDISRFAGNCFKIPTRLVFINECPKEDLRKRSNCKKDARIFTRYKLQVVEHKGLPNTNTIEKALCQYRDLYLDKYSVNSPDFTSSYLTKLIEEKVLKFYSITNEANDLLAFFTLHENGIQVTPALIGYDLKSKLPLYRALMISILQIAAQKKFVLNNSAGAPVFKMRRGGIAEVEYILVFADHLNFWRKAGYAIIEALSNLMLPVFENIAKKNWK